jgi:ribosomal protein S18 acetylase RimI-like enzyme
MAPYRITHDPAEIDPAVLHAALTRLYMCHAVPAVQLPTALANSLNFAALTNSGELAAYARVVTDQATFAHITDACVLEAHRGRGLARLIVDAILEHPALAAIPAFSISSPTNGFFAQCGHPVASPAEPAGELRRPV